MGRRCEQRIEVKLPVRVWGADQSGNPFLQSAYTVNITKNGARLRNLFCISRAGEIIRVQHGLKKANFDVRWVGHPGSAADGQVGLHCMEPEKYIWGVPLPETGSRDTFQIERQTSSSPARSRAATGPGYSRRSLGSGVSRDLAGQVLRLQQRYPCNGTAEVAAEEGAPPLLCGLSDLSISGCYVETPSPLPTYTRVSLRITVCGAQLTARGTVRNSHAGIGMGISLSEMSNADQKQLHEVIKSLVPTADSVLTPMPQSSSRILTPRPIVAPSLDSNAASEPEPKQEPEGPATLDARELGLRLHELSNELEDLPQLIRPGMVDPRVLQDFKNALAVARQMASTVQLWIELQAQNRDAFHLLHQVVEERVNIAAEANLHLIAALDAGEVDFDTSGLKKLYDSARDLHSRLQKLFRQT